MMHVFYEYSGKSFKISPYDTIIEKDILLLSAMGNPTLDDILEICGVPFDTIRGLSPEEKIAFLLKLREISVGSDINLQFTCNYCKSGNENTILISDIVKDSTISNDKIVDQFKTITSANIDDYIDVADVNELDLLEYENLVTEIHDSVTKFEFRKPTPCQKCKKINYIRIDNAEFIIENMSEDSLKSIYQVYSDMIFFSNYTKQDIDSMYPFERNILINLLNNTREEQNK